MKKWKSKNKRAFRFFINLCLALGVVPGFLSTGFADTTQLPFLLNLRSNPNNNVYVEAEKYTSNTTGTGNGWYVVSKDSTFVTANGTTVLNADSNAIGDALLNCQAGPTLSGGNNSGAVITYQTVFSTAGTYSLYLRYSMFEDGGASSYGNEDSFFISTALNTDVAANDTNNMQSGFDYANKEGKYGLLKSRFSYKVTEDMVGKTATFQIRPRETGLSLDRFVFSTKSDYALTTGGVLDATEYVRTAAITTWNSGSGTWETSGSWTAGVPVAASTAFIGNGATVTAAVSGQTLAADNLVVGYGTGSWATNPGAGTLTISGGKASFATVVLSADATTKGTLNVTGDATVAVSNGLLSSGNSLLTINQGTVTVANGLRVGSLEVGYNGTSGKTHALTVSSGDIVIGNGTSDHFYVQYKTQTDKGGINNVDFSTADSLTVNVGNFFVNKCEGVHGGEQSATLSLAKTSTITANQIIMGDSADAAGLAGVTLTLGALATTFQADTITLGGRKCSFSMMAPSGSSFTLTGTDGTGDKADVKMAWHYTNGTGMEVLDTINLADTSAVSMTIGEWIIGAKKSESDKKSGVKGTVQLGNFAKVTADSLALSQLTTGNITAYANTYLEIGKLASGTTADVNIAGSVIMGNQEKTVISGDYFRGSQTTITVNGGKLTIGGSVTETGASTLNLYRGDTVIGGSLAVDTLNVGVSNSASLIVGGAGTSDSVKIGTGTEDLNLGYVNTGMAAKFSGNVTNVDFSAVENVTVNVGKINIAVVKSDGVSMRSSVKWGVNNTITANSLLAVDSTFYGLGGSATTMEMGAGTNTLNIDSITFAGNKSGDHNVPTAINTWTVKDGGRIVINGTDGAADKAAMRLGYMTVNSAGTAMATVDFSAADSVQMNLSNLTMAYRTGGGIGGAKVILNLGDNATVNADSIDMAYMANPSGGATQQLSEAVLSFGGASNVIVDGAITMGNNATYSKSTINMDGGYLKANSIGGTGEINFNFNSGTLSSENLGFSLSQEANTIVNPVGINETGLMTIDGDYDLGAGKLVLEFGNGSSDTINVLGDFSLGTGLIELTAFNDQLAEVNTIILSNNQFTIPEEQISFVGVFPNELQFSWVDLGSGTWAYQANTGVPEPSSWLLLLLGCGLGIGYRLRKGRVHSNSAIED